MIVKQILTGSFDEFAYIVGCEKTKDAMVIDPGGEEDLILSVARESELNIKYIFNTHHHFDHVQGNARLKNLTGAKIIMHYLENDLAGPGSKADICLREEKELMVGDIIFKIYYTPGHTPGGLCLYAEGQLFTGDTLFVGDSGRTDLSGGNRPALGVSIRSLMKLPDDTVVWPGHDYGSTPTSTIGREKRTNVNAKEYGYYVAG